MSVMIELTTKKFEANSLLLKRQAPNQLGHMIP